MKKIKIKIGNLVDSLAHYQNNILEYNEEIKVDPTLYIDSPNGKTKINHVIKKTGNAIELIFNNNDILICSTKHILYSNNKEIYANDLNINDFIDTKCGPLKIIDKKENNVSEFYDISVDYPYQYYDANGILHHNTLLTATLSLICQPYGRTIVIVPSKSLVKQTEEDYLNIGLDTGVYFGERKDFGKTHTICTWQSLDRILKNEKSGTGSFTMSEFIDGVIAVIVDESHSVRANILKELLCGPFSKIPIRWGLTGTIPREDEQFFSILASIGPVVNRLSARELMDRDILAKLHIHIVQMIDTVQYGDYHAENNYLVTDKNRLDWISQLSLGISQTGNTLILVNRIETGKELERKIPGSVFISGGTSLDDRKETYDEIATASSNIIIATYGVAAVGINLPRIFNLILVEAGKSFIKTIQSIGRGVRKADDKDFLNVYDIASTCKYSAKHVSERKKIYKNADYDFLVEKLDYINQLSTGKIQLLKKKA